MYAAYRTADRKVPVRNSGASTWTGSSKQKQSFTVLIHILRAPCLAWDTSKIIFSLTQLKKEYGDASSWRGKRVQYETYRSSIFRHITLCDTKYIGVRYFDTWKKSIRYISNFDFYVLKFSIRHVSKFDIFDISKFSISYDIYRTSIFRRIKCFDIVSKHY